MSTRPGWLARAFAWTFFAVAVLAPLIANDAPLIARVDGTLYFPALRSYTGQASYGPPSAPHLSWQEWWVARDDDSDDWAVMPPWPYGPLMQRQTEARFEPPSLAHPLGRDHLGRDLLARLIWGAQTAFWIGAGTVVLAAAAGVPLGALAALGGGAADAVVSVLIEVFLCFPALFLVLIAAALLGNSATGVVLVLGTVSWPGFARLTRGELLSVRSQPWVLAARGLGLSPARVFCRHMLPQIGGPLRVNAAFLFAAAVIAESTLAFLGLGVGESWGTLLAQAREPAVRGVWHLWLFPALAITATVLCFHGLADAARARRE